MTARPRTACSGTLINKPVRSSLYRCCAVMITAIATVGVSAVAGASAAPVKWAAAVDGSPFAPLLAVWNQPTAQAAQDAVTQACVSRLPPTIPTGSGGSAPTSPGFCGVHAVLHSGQCLAVALSSYGGSPWYTYVVAGSEAMADANAIGTSLTTPATIALSGCQS